MDFYRRNELPETVKRYKTYTDQFQDWLLQTAMARQVEWATHIGEQKGTRRKGYKISIEEQERLVDGIAGTKTSLMDVSGLAHLGDAIRSRKEITQYYKLLEKADEGHAYFNRTLDSFMTTLKKLMPAFYQAQDIDDEASNFIVVQVPRQDCDKDSDTNPDTTESPEALDTHSESWEKPEPLPRKTSNDNPLTEEEQKLQQHFLILCFLYLFSRIRDVVRDVWRLYHNSLINAITAALVTDLAQSHVQQNVATLVEVLGVAQGELHEMFQTLYEEVVALSKAGPGISENPQFSQDGLRRLWCIDATKFVKTHVATEHLGVDSSSQGIRPEHPFLLFLRFFDTFRQGKITLPIWDKFTEIMLRHADGHHDWLPFGCQIILDIHDVVREDYHRLFKDVTEHGLDISRRMRVHVEYEDRMWAIGKKPDYISREVIKFSTVFLDPLNTLLTWLQSLLKSAGTAHTNSKMTTDVFVTVHSTLAGLTMWHFNKLYQATAICKVQWFITYLSHLYNAARQVGGLDITWPDLDFIIKMHGQQRIFLGDPPKHPESFLDRFYLASNVSSQYMAPDCRIRGKFAPVAPQQVRRKRGLMPHFPLEETIRAFYGPDPRNNRWVKRHAIFNYLHQRRKSSANASAQDTAEALERVKELRHTFSSIASTILPPASIDSEAGSNCTARVPVPDFFGMDETHAGLLSDMTAELQSHELHSNFDYLSFYRRAFDLTLKIRGEVMFNDGVAIARRADINKHPDPSNYILLTELFEALKLKTKAPKSKATGDEVSKDVAPLDQMKRIAEMMGDLIRKDGDMELKRAKMRLGRDWNGLKASYAAEEAEQEEPGRGDEGLAHADEQLPKSHEHELQANNDVAFDDDSDQKTKVGETKEGRSSHALPAPDIGSEFDFDVETGQYEADGIFCSTLSHLVACGEDGNDVEGEDLKILGLDLIDECDDSQDKGELRARPKEHDNSYINARGGSADQLSKMTSCEATRSIPTERLGAGSKHLLAHHAYVSDEADGFISYTAALGGVATKEQEEKRDNTSEDSLDNSMGGKGHVPETANNTFLTEDFYGNKVGQDTRFEKPEDKDSVQDVDPTMLTNRVKPVEQEAKSLTGETICVPNQVIKTRDEGDMSRARGLANTAGARSYQDLLPEPKEKPKQKLDHSGNPKGIFHRLTFSSTVSRKRAVTLKRTCTTASLTLAQRRSARTKHVHRRLHERANGHLTGIAKKHSIALPCYASCSLARALLGKETEFQRRLEKAGKILQAKDHSGPLELETAWMLACVGDLATVEDKAWESDADSN